MDKGFIVFGDIEETLNELTDEQVAKLFRGMVSYHNTGKDPGFKGVMKYVFIPIRQQMDRGAEAYREKCEKNRQNALARVERERTLAIAATATTSSDGSLTKTKTDTDAKTKTEADTESSQLDVWSLSRSVLSYLNQVAGTSYRLDGASSVRLISELAHNGYTEEQMRSVIDKKAGQWLGDPKVEGYLRPSTLFGPKFEQYLNEPDTAGKKARDEAEDRKRKQEEARHDLLEAEKEMDQLRKEFDDADGDIPRRIDIKGKMAVLDAKMEVLRLRAGPEYGKGGTSA